MTADDSPRALIQNKNFTDKPVLFSIGTFATSILAIVALLGLLLTLAGYGVALSVESQFGIPHASIFKSSSDLFSLSVWFVSWGLHNFLEMLQTVFFMPLYWQYVGLAALIGIACTVLFLIATYVKRWAIKKGLWWRLSNLDNASKPKLATILTLLAGALSASAVMIAAPIILYIGLFFCFVVGTIPIISSEAGESHIRKFVIEPTSCMQTKTRDQRLHLYENPTAQDPPRRHVANCVKIIEGEKTIASGRVVFSTNEIMVLYDPITGKVTRESLSDRTIEVLSDL